MKKLQLLFATLLFFVFVTVPVFASPTPSVATTGTIINPCATINANNNLKGICQLDLGSVVGKFVLYAFMFGAIIALLYLLWGGFKWITSGGDSKSVDGARQHIIAAIIGLIVIFLSYIILNFVVKLLTGTDLSNLVFPSL